MAFANTIFLIQFFILGGLMFSKLYNLFEKGERIDFKISILTFILSILFFGVGLMTTITEYDNTLISQLFKLETGLFILSVAFFIGELMFYIQSLSTSVIKAHNSKDFYKAKN